jgi:endonuclease-3 related protein
LRSGRKIREDLIEIYRDLRRRFGHRNWWPGETPFEVCVGAILTQNTSWTNVEKAIRNIKSAGLMDARRLFKAGKGRVARLIRPAGYFNVKAERLLVFLRVLIRDYGGDAGNIGSLGPVRAREVLLGIKGIGPETADSMLLYAMGLPVFVVDAYTKRIFSRLGFIPGGAEYHDVRKFFMENLPRDVGLYNDYHAQIVELGKNFCRKTRPKCGECPVRRRCSLKHSSFRLTS